MKTAIYLDEGTTQLVLTPENEWEKNILKMMHIEFPQTFWAGFVETRGGYIRQAQYDSEANSLMFRIAKKVDVPEMEQILGR